MEARKVTKLDRGVPFARQDFVEATNAGFSVALSRAEQHSTAWK